MGFGEQRDYISQVLSETSGGYNCYWPMPFHTAARWTPGEGGSKLTLPIPVAEAGAGEGEAVVRLVTGPDGGTVQVALGKTKAPGFIDLYAPEEGVKEITLPLGHMRDRTMPLVITYIGTNGASAGRTVGVDAVVLKPADNH